MLSLRGKKPLSNSTRLYLIYIYTRLKLRHTLLVPEKLKRRLKKGFSQTVMVYEI